MDLCVGIRLDVDVFFCSVQFLSFFSFFFLAQNCTNVRRGENVGVLFYYYHYCVFTLFSLSLSLGFFYFNGFPLEENRIGFLFNDTCTTNVSNRDRKQINHEVLKRCRWITDVYVHCCPEQLVRSRQCESMLRRSAWTHYHSSVNASCRRSAPYVSLAHSDHVKHPCGSDDGHPGWRP